MRVALIKQTLDVHGPWSTVLWKNTTPRRLLDVWPGKATFWEMTCCLEADWYIIPQQLSSDYAEEIMKYLGGTEMISQHTKGVVAPESIPVEQYDLVITFDPIWTVPADSPTLFAYFVVEHWDQLYDQSLQEPLGRYDLFLAHMLDAPKKLLSLPQSLAFPYLCDPDAAHGTFPAEKDDAVWADFRTLTSLGMAENYGMWVATGHSAAKRLEETLGLPVRYKDTFKETRPYGISNPPSWGDAVDYFESMARCRFYIAVGTIAGAGQAICDAASLDCLCIGQQENAFHRLICHPAALCISMIELPRRLRAIVGSHDLQHEILAWQDTMLRDFFQRRPLELLEEAISIKCANGAR